MPIGVVLRRLEYLRADECRNLLVILILVFRVNRDQMELQSLEIVSEIFDVSCESFSDDLLELRCVVGAVVPVDRNIGMRDRP